MMEIKVAGIKKFEDGLNQGKGEFLLQLNQTISLYACVHFMSVIYFRCKDCLSSA